MTENPSEAANLYSMTIHQDHIAGDVNPNSGVNGGGEGYAAMAEANGGGVEEEDDDDEVGMMDEDHHHHHQNHHQEHDHDGDLGSGAIGPHIVSGSQQLTLSFQGEVYVFDNVSPEKVQAVLLLLGGREVPTPVPSVPLASQQYNKGPNFPHRVASLMRFREKRKERNFDKKIRYTVRKEVALRMQRNKGQFTSSKSKIDDAAPGDTTLDATQRWGSVDGRPQAASECHHCGISSKSTPMMRRGPDGPRTLCNACGLMWANKGLLKDLSKSPTLPTQNTLPVAPIEGNGTTMTVSEQQPVAGTANGHDSLS